MLHVIGFVRVIKWFRASYTLIVSYRGALWLPPYSQAARGKQMVGGP